MPRVKLSKEEKAERKRNRTKYSYIEQMKQDEAEMPVTLRDKKNAEIGWAHLDPHVYAPFIAKVREHILAEKPDEVQEDDILWRKLYFVGRAAYITGNAKTTQKNREDNAARKMLEFLDDYCATIH